MFLLLTWWDHTKNHQKVLFQTIEPDGLLWQVRILVGTWHIHPKPDTTSIPLPHWLNQKHHHPMSRLITTLQEQLWKILLDQPPAILSLVLGPHLSTSMEYLRQKPQGCLLNSKDFIGELSLLKVHVNGHQGFMPICENWVPKHHHLLFL